MAKTMAENQSVAGPPSASIWSKLSRKPLTAVVTAIVATPNAPDHRPGTTRRAAMRNSPGRFGRSLGAGGDGVMGVVAGHEPWQQRSEMVAAVDPLRGRWQHPLLVRQARCEQHPRLGTSQFWPRGWAAHLLQCYAAR